jgi:hypothetical protein
MMNRWLCLLLGLSLTFLLGGCPPTSTDDDDASGDDDDATDPDDDDTAPDDDDTAPDDDDTAPDDDDSSPSDDDDDSAVSDDDDSVSTDDDDSVSTDDDDSVSTDDDDSVSTDDDDSAVSDDDDSVSTDDDDSATSDDDDSASSDDDDSALGDDDDSAVVGDDDDSALGDDDDSAAAFCYAEIEPNDDPLTQAQGPLTIPGYYCFDGEINPDQDADVWQVDLAATSRVTVATSNPAGGGCNGISGGVDTEIFVYDGGGNEITSDDDSGVEQGCSFLSAVIDPGTWYFGVEYWNRFSSSQGPYVFEVAIEPAEGLCADGYDDDGDGDIDCDDEDCAGSDDCLVEINPNDSQSDADYNGLFPLPFFANGNIDHTGDYDWYALDVPAGGDLTVWSDCTNTSFDSEIILYNASGTEIDSADSVPCESMTTAVTAGTHYVVIHHWYDDQMGYYELYAELN